VAVARFSGEHRLPACPFRQLAEKLFERSIPLQRSGCRRQAADDSRLAACAPQATELLEMIADDLEDHRVIDHAAEIVCAGAAA
jgi:hypothetical protein